MDSNREPFKFNLRANTTSVQYFQSAAPRRSSLVRRLPLQSLMAPRTTSNLHRQRATACVATPRTTSKLDHRASAGVEAPSTTSNLHHQHATAGAVTPRTTKRATAGVVEPLRTTTSAATSILHQRAPAAPATATHDLVVLGYSKLKMLGVGQYISSDAFRAGGHDWEIRFYPKLSIVDGTIADYRPPFFPGGASLHLCDADKDTELTVRFTLSVLQRDRLVSPMASRTKTEIFSSRSPPLQRHGFNKLVDGSILMPRQCIHNDALTIRCTLTVVCVKDLVPPPTSNLDQLRATAGGVVVPRTTCNLHQRAMPSVVAPRTTSNLPAGGDACGEPSNPKTSSWRVVERATATHDFVVTEYSKLKMLGVGQYVSSDAFRAGGHDWKIRLYPKPPLAMGGLDKYRPPLFPGGAGLHLCDVDEDTELTVEFTLSVLHRSGRVSPLASRTAKVIFGAPPREHYGFHRLVDENESDMPELWRCIRNDALTIRCTLAVVGARDPVPPPELAAHPGPLLGTGMDEDVTFQVGGRAFPAHRDILAARSPVFRAELFGDMMEKDAPCIKIVGMRPEVFELLLQFIYTETLPGDGDGCDAPTMQHLLVAADRYGLDRLKHICELKLHATVDAETVASMLALVECHSCPRLRDACVACMTTETIS